MRLRPLHPQICYQQADMPASFGQRARSIAGGAEYSDLTVPELLLHGATTYGDHLYENVMNVAAQLQFLGVVTGVLDGPTDEYRAKIKEVAGSYLDNLIERSQHESIWSRLGPLDAVSSLIGYAYDGSAVVADWAGLDETAEGYRNTADLLHNTDPDAFLGNLLIDGAQQVWDACKARWDEFWEEFEQKGLIHAFAHAKADLHFLMAEIAIDIALGVATGGIAVGVKIVGQRLVGAATRIVLRTANKATRAAPDTRVLAHVRISDQDIDRTILERVLDEDNLGTGSNADDLARRSEIATPNRSKPEGGRGADEPELPPTKTDEWADGSYRNPADPRDVRRTVDGEAMIQNKDGTWRPVSAMSDPNRVGDNGRRHNPQLGRWGEVEADRYAADQGWQKLNGANTTMDSRFTGPGRIDAVYYNPNPPPGPYIVSDAKALGSGQGKTSEGVLQMSDEWIRDRLGNANLSPEHLRGLNRGHAPVLLRVDKHGNVTEEWLDEAGNIIKPVWRNE